MPEDEFNNEEFDESEEEFDESEEEFEEGLNGPNQIPYVGIGDDVLDDLEDLDDELEEEEYEDQYLGVPASTSSSTSTSSASVPSSTIKDTSSSNAGTNQTSSSNTDTSSSPYKKADNMQDAYSKTLDNKNYYNDAKDKNQQKLNDIKNKKSQLQEKINKDKQDRSSGNNGDNEKDKDTKDRLKRRQRGRFSGNGSAGGDSDGDGDSSKKDKKELKKLNKEEKNAKKEAKDIKSDEKKSKLFEKLHPLKAAKAKAGEKAKEAVAAIWDKIPFKVKAIIIAVFVGILVIALLIMACWAYIDDALARLDEGATYVADSHEKWDNFLNGLGFQNSEDAFYMELNKLNKDNNFELNIPIIMATLYYDETHSNGEVGLEQTTDDDGDNTLVAIALARRWIKEKVAESNETIGKDGLVYSSNKIYRLRKLARNQFDNPIFGKGTNQKEHVVGIMEYLNLIQAKIDKELFELLKSLFENVVNLYNPANLAESIYQCLIAGDEDFFTTDTGAHFEDLKNNLVDLLDAIFSPFFDISGITLYDGNECTNAVCVKYNTYSYSEEAYLSYLKKYYIKNMPEFKKYINADTDEIRDQQIEKIIKEIQETAANYEDVFGIKKKSTENYNNDCPGNIKQSLLGDLEKPVNITKTVSFTNGYGYGISGGMTHKGVDLNSTTAGVNQGDDVYSIYNDGEVIESTADSTYKESVKGGWVKIRYKSSSGSEAYDFSILYGGLAKDSLTLKKGDKVKKKDVIGKIGSKEESEDEKLPSLHFGFYDETTNRWMDPSNLFIKCSSAVTGDQMNIHDIYSISEENFVKAINEYCASHYCHPLLKSWDLNVVYRVSVQNNLNPRFPVLRAIDEGFSPAASCSNYNYWGIAVYNTEGSCGTRYSSLADGVKGLANLEIIKNNDTLYDLMKLYGYIGDYWYPVRYTPSGQVDWGLGGCVFVSYSGDYLEEFYTNKARHAEVKAWCEAGTGGSHRTNEEDQDAYTKFLCSKMAKNDEAIFGPYLNTTTSTDTDDGGDVELPSETLIWPVPSLPIGSTSSAFGFRTHPVSGEANVFHHGEDYPAAQGSTIVSASNGKVCGNYFNSARGWTLVIFDEKTSTKFVYQHMNVQSPLAVGQSVSAGAKIGTVGSTGQSTGPHLHFEIHINDSCSEGIPYDKYNGAPNTVDPKKYNYISSPNTN